eukprot:3898201-Rhodomonas_salina.2
MQEPKSNASIRLFTSVEIKGKTACSQSLECGFSCDSCRSVMVVTPHLLYAVPGCTQVQKRCAEVELMCIMIYHSRADIAPSPDLGTEGR